MLTRQRLVGIFVAVTLVASACADDAIDLGAASDSTPSPTADVSAPAEDPAEDPDTTDGSDEVSAGGGQGAEDTDGDDPEPGRPLPVDEFAYEETACEFDPPEDVEVSCAWLDVPEDRTEVDGPTVRLHVARFSAAGDDGRDDPIVYLEGGPGGHSLETLRFSYDETFAPLNVDRDLIFFDQRGTGFSDPAFTCPVQREELFALSIGDVAADEESKAALDAMLACRDELVDEGADLTRYNSLESAADVEALRLALGVDEWNLLGISYGTRLAQTVMREYPEGVRSVILDSVVPLDRVGVEIPEGGRRSFELLFSTCEAEPECAERYPDLETVYFETIDALDDEPLAFEFNDPDSGATVEGVVDGTDLLQTTFSALYSPTGFAGLPQLTFDLAAGDTDSYATYAQLDLLNERFFSIGFFMTVLCNEDLPFLTEGDLTGSLTGDPYYDRLGEDSEGPFPTMVEICDQWGSGRAPAVEDAPVVSDLPTLLLTGEFDPITPPSFMDDVAAGLSNGQALVFPGFSHGVTGEECGREVELSFLADPAAAVDVGCIAALGPPTLVDTTVGEIELIEVTEELLSGETVTFVAPEAWIPQGDATFARLRSILDPTSLIVLGVPGGTDGERLVGLFADFLGIDAAVEDLGSVSAGGNEWERFEIDDGSQALVVAVTSGDSGDIVVVMGAESGQRAELVELLFDPLLDSFVIG